MSESIRVDNVSKRYELGVLRNQETQLRDQLAKMLTAPFRRSKRARDVLWALKDVSFSVQEGEIVGIIGGNGAGKSTLLKILSKITYPTSGEIRIRGRVASLLEVGTGFHEELTGTENILLNGSILGMKRKEVMAKMDAIVSFSGVERFLDVPIKRYSSGMRLRLGFAVAAHLDPDVLIVDEVLAVGDAGFQKKCLTAMESLRSGGRTVLFVSHHMSAVQNLCNRGLWIDRGNLRLDGPTKDVIEAYMRTFAEVSKGASDIANAESRRGTGEIRYTKIELLSEDREPKNFVRSGDAVVIRMHFVAEKPVAYPSFGFRLVTETGSLVTDTSTWHHGIQIETVGPGPGHVDLCIDALNLMPGRYYLTLGLSGVGGHLYDWVEHAVTTDIEAGSIYGSGLQLDQRYGAVFFPQRWQLGGLHGTIAGR
jgi:lipopolysaccharide transport system ATP-binding protein